MLIQIQQSENKVSFHGGKIEPHLAVLLPMQPHDMPCGPPEVQPEGNLPWVLILRPSGRVQRLTPPNLQTTGECKAWAIPLFNGSKLRKLQASVFRRCWGK